MKNISLNFFGEKVTINMPTTLASLRKEISDKSKQFKNKTTVYIEIKSGNFLPSTVAFEMSKHFGSSRGQFASM